LGHGRYQRRIQATVTSKTQSIASEIASDKRLTRQILDQLGLPVPRQEVVHGADEAVAGAERIGYPGGGKPLGGNQGRGVSIDLKNDAQVRDAFTLAQEASREVSRGVIVESFQPGHDYRILVVDGRVVAVAQRVPGHVVGDGRHTIAELV